MKLSRIKSIVGKCLAEDPSTRNSDMKLYIRVCQTIGINTKEVTLSDIYFNVGTYPSFESVSRARRKYQADGEYKADIDVQEQRTENIKEYIKEFC